MSNNLNHKYKNVIYTLKRRLGQSITYKQDNGQSIDLDAGTITPDVTSVTIKRAVVTMNIADIKIFNPNTQMFMSGKTETNQRFVIIDSKDINLTPEEKDKVVIDSLEYEVLKVETVPDNHIFIIKVGA